MPLFPLAQGRHLVHAGRGGLAPELTSRGASTTDVMLAGNWKTSRMVADYSAGATAERGAVARFRRARAAASGGMWRTASPNGLA